MFTMVGAAVDIPHRIHKMLGNLGPKLYFLRVPKNKKDEDTYFGQLTKLEDFKKNKKEVEEALLDYLAWFDRCLDSIEENNIQKFAWDGDKDEEKTLRAIIKLSKLLAHLRGNVPTWETHDSQGSEYAYSLPTIEEPDRAMSQLRNLARGHALSRGRNYITKDDLGLVISVVLSTAMKERVAIFDLLIQNQGQLTTSQITEYLNASKPTARRTMAEFKALGIVTLKNGNNNEEHKITLKSEFAWFLSDEFKESVKEKSPISSDIDKTGTVEL